MFPDEDRDEAGFQELSVLSARHCFGHLRTGEAIELKDLEVPISDNIYSLDFFKITFLFI